MKSMHLFSGKPWTSESVTKIKGDVNELAEQLKKVSENPSLLNSIKQQVSLHTIIPTIEQEYNLYQRLYERIVG